MEAVSYRISRRQMTQVAEYALARYDLGLYRITFLNGSENTTFRVDLGEERENRRPDSEGYRQGRFLLRIHYPGHPRQDSAGNVPALLDSELLWLQRLRQGEGLVVPTSVANRDGALVTAVTAEGALSPIYCTLMRWVEGRFLSDRGRPERAFRVGALIARLHQNARQWLLPNGFVRPRYDAAWLRERLAAFRCHVASGLLSNAQYQVFEASVDRICDVMAVLGDGPEALGLVHADLHNRNYLFHQGAVRPIDFSYCGFGYFLYDIAYAMNGVWNRGALLEGYSSVRPLPPHSATTIEAFMVLGMVGEVMTHAGNPKERANLQPGIPSLTRTLQEKFLRGERFMFGW